MNSNLKSDSPLNSSAQIILTAEYPDGVIVHQFTTERKYLRGENYLRIFAEPLAVMAEDKDLKYTDLRVLIKLLSCVNYENSIQISQAALGQELGLAQSAVSRSLKKLVAKRYLDLVGQVGKQNVYQLNPYFGFKCKARHLEELQRAFKPIQKPNSDQDVILEEIKTINARVTTLESSFF